MKRFKMMVLLAVCGLMGILASGCTPYDTPEYKDIEPSQTAFMIPLEGQTSSQAGFQSEQYLRDHKVAAKRVQIPHRWIKEGRGPGSGKYLPTMRLIVVERKPVTREWTESSSTGTSNKNEGITAESKESIGFMARMNCSAQIDEVDAVRFLYRYNNKPLDEVMDTEIRPRVESKYVEQCSHYPLSQLIVRKDAIMNAVRKDVMPYFKERGITITVLGLKGEFTYLDKNIQDSINARFTAAQERKTQDDVNAKVLSKARADAQANRLISAAKGSSYLQYQIRMKELENQGKAIDKWNGQLPAAMGVHNAFGLPISVGQTAVAQTQPQPATETAAASDEQSE